MSFFILVGEVLPLQAQDILTRMTVFFKSLDQPIIQVEKN